ncbi:MAG TPA: FHA domain-containing protein [Anaerolineae bacterium]|nr:FHA domain-containing protein [Anaerolineae bacterium]HQI83660.1 FHA domain-containing protein [Anaerolineae bacterium]
MAFCTICGAQQPDDAAFCAICGAALKVAAPQPPQPLTCPRCGAPLEPDSLFCDMCGASLSRAEAAVIYSSTEPLVQPEPQDAPVYAPGPVPAHLVIQDSQTTLHLPQGKAEIIIGRDDPISNLFPDIDLTDYGGDKTGVSRQHARILFQNGRFFLEDRNSTNHTYLNEQLLEPWQPYPLRHGDEICFGRLKVRFYL